MTRNPATKGCFWVNWQFLALLKPCGQINLPKSLNRLFHSSVSVIGDVPPIYEVVKPGDVPPMGDAPPILVSPGGDEVIKKLILRALNENQRLILRSINGRHRSLNSLLEEISRREKRPISTLKLNARILKELGLIDYGTKDNPRPVRLTEHGLLVLSILEVDGNE